MYSHATLAAHLPKSLDDRVAVESLLARFDPQKHSYLVWRLYLEFGEEFFNTRGQTLEQLRVIAHVTCQQAELMRNLRESHGWEGPTSDATRVIARLADEVKEMGTGTGDVERAQKNMLAMTALTITSDDESLEIAIGLVEAIADYISGVQSDTKRLLSPVARAVYRYLTPELGDFDGRRWQAIVDIDDLLQGAFAPLEVLNARLGGPRVDSRFLDQQILPPGSHSGKNRTHTSNGRERPSWTAYDVDRLGILDLIERQYPNIPKVLEPHFSRVTPTSTARRRNSPRGALADYHVLEIAFGPKVFAVAASPMAGQDAIYIVRSDVSSKPWREVLTETKQQARYLGARSLRVTGESDSKYTQAAEKVIAYLTCDSHSFRTSFPRFYDGRWSVGVYS